MARTCLSLKVVFLVAIGCSVAGAIITCELRKYLGFQERYFLYNPGYPRNYTSDIFCRWIVTAPRGYNCRLNCSLNLPKSTSCYSDRLVVSTGGDPFLLSSTAYCDQRSVIAVSTNQTITIALITPPSTPGGNFWCELTTHREGWGTKYSTSVFSNDTLAAPNPGQYPNMKDLMDLQDSESLSTMELEQL